jgi:hypothetical protein
MPEDWAHSRQVFVSTKKEVRPMCTFLSVFRMKWVVDILTRAQETYGASTVH